MMAAPTPDKRVVYLHCRSIFSGANALFRQKKKVRQVLTKKKASITTLTHEFSLDAICVVAKELLEEGVFASEMQARLRFPELFKTSEAQLAERQASEALAARSEAEAIEEIIALSENDEDIESVKDKNEGSPEAKKQGQSTSGGDATRPIPSATVHATGSGPATISVPNLHPVYLPYRTQHRILNMTQALVEECCFEFGKKWLPQIITKEGWEGPESGELTKWTKHLKKQAKEIPDSAVCQVAGTDWTRALFGCNQLRHAAVHRLKMTAKGVLGLLDSANALAKMLNDIKRSSQIEAIKDELDSIVEGTIRNKHLLENKLLDELQALAKRRAELDELERIAVESMIRSDRDHLAVVGSALEDLLVQLDGKSNGTSCGVDKSSREVDEMSPELEDNEACSEHQSSAEDSPHSAAENHPSTKAPPLEETCLVPEDDISGELPVKGKPAPAEDIALAGEATSAEIPSLTDDATPMQESLLMEEVNPAKDITLVKEPSWAKEATSTDEAASIEGSPLMEENTSKAADPLVEKSIPAQDSFLAEGTALPEEAALVEATITVHKAGSSDQPLLVTRFKLEPTERKCLVLIK